MYYTFVNGILCHQQQKYLFAIYVVVECWFGKKHMYNTFASLLADIICEDPLCVCNYQQFHNNWLSVWWWVIIKGIAHKTECLILTDLG